MTTLPACRHRGREIATGRYACSSNRLIHKYGTASVETCLKCPYANSKNRQFQFGDWLAKLFSGFSLKPKSGCGCKARQWKMNRFGDRLISTLRAFTDKILGKGD